MLIECHTALPETLADEWDMFMLQARHAHPRQFRAFAPIESALGHDVLHVIGRQDGSIRAVGQFSFRRDRLLPGSYARAVALSGPVCDDPKTMLSFLSEIARSAPFARVAAISVTPYWLDTEAEELASALGSAGWKVSDPDPVRYTGVIDLTRSADVIRASLAANARRKIRQVEESKVEIRPLETLAEIEMFFEHLNRLVLRRHRFTAVAEAEYKAGFQSVYRDPSVSVILGAWNEDTFLGGLLLYRSARFAHARRYVANPAAGKLRIAPALWYQGMLWAKAQGCSMLDVEGFRVIEDKSDQLFNVYEYKREFRPVPALRMAEHTLVLNAVAYSLNQLPQNARSLLRRQLPFLASAWRKRT
jgi:lipid II:glycine glycyltransferase (peptidoglycan interpeptide bridge formation enzyme)